MKHITIKEFDRIREQVINDLYWRELQNIKKYFYVVMAVWIIAVFIWISYNDFITYLWFLIIGYQIRTASLLEWKMIWCWEWFYEWAEYIKNPEAY